MKLTRNRKLNSTKTPPKIENDAEDEPVVQRQTSQYFYLVLVHIYVELEIQFLLYDISVSVGASDDVTDFQRFQIPLAPKMFPTWEFVVGIFDQKAMLNIDWVLSLVFI